MHRQQRRQYPLRSGSALAAASPPPTARPVCVPGAAALRLRNAPGIAVGGLLAEAGGSVPVSRYSLLSIDPRLCVTQDGGAVHHAFSCLRDFNQARAKVVVGITAYNESWPEISATIQGVVDNLRVLQRWADADSDAASAALNGAVSDPLTGGGVTGHAALRHACSSLSPQELVVVVIFDGREKMSTSMFSGSDDCVLSPAHQQQMAAAVVALKAQQQHPRTTSSGVRDLHLFELEYVPSPSPPAEGDSDADRGAAVGVNLLLAVKEANGGKLNSHVWLFRTFCPLLAPRYVVLLDAGTVPAPTALLRLYADMEDNAHIGGCAGEICVDRQQQSTLSLVVSAQLFEYAAANLLDKSMESVFGFISVLPGAFSAYRYEAVSGAPLDTYFRLEDRDAAGLSPAQANAYLAEDRLLGFEIVAKTGCQWTLHYDHAAQAFTDVPDTIGKLVRQRRRWGNGSLFAQLLALSQWWRLLGRTRHNLVRKAGFVVLFALYSLQTMLSLLVLGNLYFAYSLLYRVLGTRLDSAAVSTVFTVLMWVYELLQAMLFVFSLGNRPEESETVWSVSVHGLGAFNAVSTGLLVWLLSDFLANWMIWTAGLGAMAAVLLCAVLQRRLPWILASIGHFMWMAPMFLLLFPIYSLCNTHDVSWGTREAHATATQAAVRARMDRVFRQFRSRLVLLWLVVNVVFVGLLNLITQPASSGVVGGGDALLDYVVGIAAVSAFMLGLRVAGCIAYVALEYIKPVCCGGCCRVRSAPFLPAHFYAGDGPADPYSEFSYAAPNKRAVDPHSALRRFQHQVQRAEEAVHVDFHAEAARPEVNESSDAAETSAPKLPQRVPMRGAGVPSASFPPQSLTLVTGNGTGGSGRGGKATGTTPSAAAVVAASVSTPSSSGRGLGSRFFGGAAAPVTPKYAADRPRSWLRPTGSRSGLRILSDDAPPAGGYFGPGPLPIAAEDPSLALMQQQQQAPLTSAEMQRLAALVAHQRLAGARRGSERMLGFRASSERHFPGAQQQAPHPSAAAMTASVADASGGATSSAHGSGRFKVEAPQARRAGGRLSRGGSGHQDADRGVGGGGRGGGGGSSSSDAPLAARGAGDDTVISQMQPLPEIRQRRRSLEPPAVVLAPLKGSGTAVRVSVAAAAGSAHPPPLLPAPATSSGGGLAIDGGVEARGTVGGIRRGWEDRARVRAAATSGSPAPRSKREERESSAP